MNHNSDDVLVRFSALERISKFEYLGMNTRPVCAPSDDLERVARALTVCVGASRG